MCLSYTYRAYGLESRRTSQLAAGARVLRSQSEDSTRAATPPTPEYSSRSASPIPPMTNRKTDTYLQVTASEGNTSAGPLAPTPRTGPLSTPATSNQPPTPQNTLFNAGGAHGTQPAHLYGPTYFANPPWQGAYHPPPMPSHEQLQQYWLASNRRNIYCYFFLEAFKENIEHNRNLKLPTRYSNISPRIHLYSQIVFLSRSATSDISFNMLHHTY